MASFINFLESFPTDRFYKGKEFERFVKWFLTNEPVWASQVEKVWLWDEFPERWGRDCGVDLVFRHINGELWAVQAKCYSPDKTIKKEDIDSFLSESNRPLIKKRLLIATTDEIGPNARRVCEEQEKRVTRYLLSDFITSNISYPDNISQLEYQKRKAPPTPRPHQIRAIEAVANSLREESRGQLIMACGTGKTLTTLWIKEKLSANKTLVLLPSLNLLSQTLASWTFANNEKFESLCVCSDRSVVKNDQGEDALRAQDLSFPVSSDIVEIKDFLRRSGPIVVFCTYQSSELITLCHEDKESPSFDLIIADEAHRCTGRAMTCFTTVLDDRKIRSKKRLFATATPRTYSSRLKNIAEEVGVEVVGMDDVKAFGKVMFQLTFREAINQKLLSDYQVCVIGISNEVIASWVRSGRIIAVSEHHQSDARSVASQIGVIRAAQDYNLTSIITFHSRIHRAKCFSEGINQISRAIAMNEGTAVNLAADYVSGKMPTGHRRVKIDSLRATSLQDRRLLSNSRCLSEGIDVPSLDGIAFIDPRASQIDIIQAVGRAIRLSDDKKIGTIVIPVFIEDAHDPVSAIEMSDFKHVWDVINALKSHDEELNIELEEMRFYIGRNRQYILNHPSIRNIVFDFPDTLDQIFIDSIKIRLVENTTSSWSYWYGLFISWREINGDTVPEVSEEYEGRKIGVWAATQRTNYKKGRLSEIRAIRLTQLPGWTWDKIEDQWVRGYEHLKNYHERTGSCSPPDRYKTNDGFKLGSWVKTRRLDYSRGILRDAKIAQLEEFPDWSWNPNYDQWLNIYKELYELTKDTQLKDIERGRNQEKFSKYSKWINAQKRNYRAQQKTDGGSKYSSLNDEQINLLGALLGWSWDRKKDRWFYYYELLISYLTHHSFSSLTASTIHKKENIGRWIVKQRAASRDGKLEDWKRDLLDDLGWVAEPFLDQWKMTYKILCEYVIGNESRIPQSTIYKGQTIGRWVSKQRQSFKMGQLSAERQELLEKISGWTWDASSDAAHELSKRGLSPSKIKHAD